MGFRLGMEKAVVGRTEEGSASAPAVSVTVAARRPSVEPTDERLLTAARQGDADALEALLVRYQSRVYRFGMRMCGDPEDAKDVFQETLLAMARSVRDFRGASSISTWLYSIARSFCIKTRRRSRFAPVRHEALTTAAEVAALQLPDPHPGPEEQVASRQIETILARAIAALDPKLREVLVLRDVEGLSASEVAEVVGVTVNAVKSRLHRARLAVRAQVAPHLGMDVETLHPHESTHPCPDVLHLLSSHLEGDISPDICVQMERHLEHCARCATACESLKQTLALCQRSPAPRVPAALQESVRRELRRFLAART
jgi:RNA polymerase sigma-70 factor, ECF subfamily